MREDYSPHGTAWDYFPHDHARSRAYRWNEDGLAGISDRHQKICFALALWNEHDPILKERLFGLTGSEGNHGEDVKEYYFYLDSTPTHSFMRYLYKYPQAAFPYARLVDENRRRGRARAGVRAGRHRHLRRPAATSTSSSNTRKRSPDDILIRIIVENRGPEPAPIRVLPTVWFRNTWSWDTGEPRPALSAGADLGDASTVVLQEPQYGERWLYCDGAPELLFTENDTNAARLFGQAPRRLLQGRQSTTTS